MNVKEMREWLKQFPDDTKVQVISEEEYDDYHRSTYCARVNLIGTDGYNDYEYTDFSKNELSDCNDRILILGAEK